MTDLLARLDAAITIHGDHEFLEAVGNLDSRYDQVDFTRRPAPLCWFASLFHLHWTTAGQGIENYLLLDNDLDFALTLDSARRLSAERTVTYLEAAAALYPRKRVPVNDRQRSAVIERLHTQARDTGNRNPLYVIDDRFDDALPNLAANVRAWIVAHRHEVDDMLRRVPLPAGGVRSELEMLEDALSGMERLGARVHERRRSIIAPFRDAAVAKGMAPWEGTLVDPRAARFYAATAQFGESDWLAVAKRKLEAGRKFRSAERLVSETLPLIKKSDFVHSDQFEQMLEAAWKLRRPAVESARSMPVQVVSDGQEIGLLSGANDAVIAVSFCLAIHEWLMLTPQGLKAAMLLYGLFDELAPCPEIPTRTRPRSAKKNTK